MGKCPVCDAELKELYHDIMWGWGTMEKEEECPKCKLYTYRFSYGYTEETIGQEQWGWSYNESKEEWDQRRIEQKEHLERLRKTVVVSG